MIRLVPMTAAVLVALGGATIARADTAEAMCELRKEGDTRKNATGPCTFSQRQGYVDVALRNGEKVSLRPTEKANQFKDDNGNVVVRTASAKQHEYKWKDKPKRLIVTFQ